MNICSTKSLEVVVSLFMPFHDVQCETNKVEGAFSIPQTRKSYGYAKILPVNNNGSRRIIKVKQSRTHLVLVCVTHWEYQVLRPVSFCMVRGSSLLSSFLTCLI